MYYFDKTLCKKSFDLLDNVKDLSDIAKDIRQIKTMIDYSILYTYADMIELDKYIQDKYPEIKFFKELADSIKWKEPLGLSSSYSQCMSLEIEKLKFDLYYLLALALKRSGKIAKLSDFFDKSYISND